MTQAKQYLPPGSPGRCWLRSDRRIYDTSPRSHLELVALLAIRGRMRYFVDGSVVTLGSGSLLWAHTDQSHFLLSESPGFEMWVLVLAPELLHPSELFPPRLAAAPGYAPGLRQIGHDGLGELSSIARTLRRTADPDMLRIGLRWWTARAWTVWSEAGPSVTRQLHPSVRRAVETLRLETETPLAQIAKQAGASLSNLRRQFRAELGMSLIEFRTERRLERADAILSQAKPPALLAAALAAGFGSYSQFYRAFVAARGTTPSRYYALPELRQHKGVTG